MDGEFNLAYECGGKGRTYHSFVAGGKDVFGAGKVTIQDGKIVNVNAWSGHYISKTPKIFTQDSLDVFKEYSENLGLDISSAFFDSSPPPQLQQILLP